MLSAAPEIPHLLGFHAPQIAHEFRANAKQTEKVYLYNNSIAVYDLVQTVTLNTTNTQSQVTVSNAANYMSGGLYTGGTGGTSYTHSIDYVSINCTP